MDAKALTIVVKTMESRIDFFYKMLSDSKNDHQKAIDESKADHKEDSEALAECRRTYDTEIALLKREVEELKKNKETWGNRSFTIFMSVISIALSGLIAWYVKKP